MAQDLYSISVKVSKELTSAFLLCHSWWVVLIIAKMATDSLSVIVLL